MKKFKMIMLFLIIVLGCSGCEGDITRDIRHAGFTLSNSEFTCDMLMPSKKNGNSFEKIQYLGGSYAITDKGKIYELSLGQVYANKQNCKEADTDIKVVAIFDGKVFKGSDNKYYSLVATNNVAPYSLVTVNDNSYNMYNLLLSDPNVLKVQTVNQNTGSYYVLKTDGNVYNYMITRASSQDAYSIVSMTIAYNKNDFGGSIIDFYEAGNNLTTYVKTAKDIYRMKITNKEECAKYADVSCKYKFSKDDTLSEYYDRIIAYNGGFLITDYGREFNVGA